MHFLAWIILIALVVYLALYFKKKCCDEKNSKDSLDDVLQARHANGEINTEQLDKIKEILEEK